MSSPDLRVERPPEDNHSLLDDNTRLGIQFGSIIRQSTLMNHVRQIDLNSHSQLSLDWTETLPPLLKNNAPSFHFVGLLLISSRREAISDLSYADQPLDVVDLPADHRSSSRARTLQSLEIGRNGEILLRYSPSSATAIEGRRRLDDDQELVNYLEKIDLNEHLSLFLDDLNGLLNTDEQMENIADLLEHSRHFPRLIDHLLQLNLLSQKNEHRRLNWLLFLKILFKRQNNLHLICAFCSRFIGNLAESISLEQMRIVLFLFHQLSLSQKKKNHLLDLLDTSEANEGNVSLCLLSDDLIFHFSGTPAE